MPENGSETTVSSVTEGKPKVRPQATETWNETVADHGETGRWEVFPAIRERTSFVTLLSSRSALSASIGLIRVY